MINLTDAERLIKTQISYEKALNKLEKGGIPPLNLIKGIYRKPTAKIYSMVMA